MRIEGQKTCAYEICEQLAWQVPDKVIIPTSSGGNISALWKGWKELHHMKVINKLPSLVVVQAEGCCPIVKAFKERKETVEPLAKVRTIAHSISNPAPPSGRRALKLLEECGGLAEAVSDEELLQAQKMLTETEGIFAEVAGAASVAGLKKLLARGLVKGEETVVCLVTGTGLKDIKTAMKTSGKPLRLESWADCRRLLKALAF
jgi:threonine synthase